jgi:hypothetical protein
MIRSLMITFALLSTLSIYCVQPTDWIATGTSGGTSTGNDTGGSTSGSTTQSGSNDAPASTTR